jgi:exopolysaccharide biosynthesis polyprenyl glycosylphosphotransferase
MALTAFLPEDEAASLWQERRHAFLQAVSSKSGRRRSGHRRYRKIERYPSLSEPGRRAFKRAFDCTAASLALLLLAPLFITIAAIIKLTSRGPVFFTQRRYGYRNRRFHIYKFRTMYDHLGDRAGTRQAMRDDTRVTPIGRILRATSLDELPQLINVVKGDMSLVGPRPHVPRMLAAELLYEDLVPYYFQRHSVRPGITGLAQVNGCRGSTAQANDAITRIDYDLEYIEKWSLWLDIKIIVKTARREFLLGSGA